ncbi:MAG: Uma2 family endonuclease [Limnospira sp.]
MIEFSHTTLNKDLTEKRTLYAEVAIAEYWVVNLRDRELIVFRNPKHGNYTTEIIYRSGIVSPLAFGDIRISVEHLLDPESP